MSITDPYIRRDPYLLFEQKICSPDPRFRIDPTTSNTCTINGDIFFSPNCTRPLVLPSQSLTLPLNPKVDDPNRFLSPQWFSTDSAHLAFFPLHPLSGDAFNGLFAYLPAIKVSVPKGFRLDTEILLTWNKLEFNLLLMARLLLGINRAPIPKDVIEDPLICTEAYKSKRLLESAVTKTIDCFSERAALMSYAIAVALTMADEPLNSFMPPAWFTYLVHETHNDWDQAYVSSVRTTLGQFGPWTRAGVLVQVANPDRYQYSVEWLCKFNVPVWYPWGAKEITAALTDPLIAVLAPPVTDLQEVHTFLHKSPTAESDTRHAETAHPWIAFFEEKQRRIEVALKTEDPKHRQVRESRAKNPPKKKTKVFIWEQDASGTYIRTKVSAKWNEDNLANYSRNQRRYDSFNNEWDCGPFDGHDSGSESDDDEFFQLTESEVQMEPPTSPIASTSSLAPVPPAWTSEPKMSSRYNDCDPAQHQTESAQYHDEHEWNDYYECSETLKEFFGFVPATTSFQRNLATNVTDQELKFIKSIAGVSRLDPEFENSRLALDVMEFIRPLMSKTADSVPKNELWDLAESNYRYVGGAWRFKCLRLHKISSGMVYVFDFGDQYATVEWNLGVTNAVDALYICRLHSGMTDYDICRQLLQRGIQFHTFLARNWTSDPRSIVAPPLPVRLEGYKFTQRDYETYLSDFQHLLKNPRIARAALMKGGIIWRLVVSHVGFDNVFLGPTTNVTLYSRGLCIDTGYGDTRLWDDDIADEELDAIVGMHVCMTGQGDTYSLKSWWPSHKTWNTYNPRSFWSSLEEEKYQKRLLELERTADPLTATAWKDRLRGPGVVRTVNKANLESSEAFLQRLRGDF